MENGTTDFLANIPSEGEAFSLGNNDVQEKETPAAPPTEDNQTDTAPSPGGANNQDDSNVPFHKHPRWIQMREERDQLDARLRELELRTSSQAASQAQPQEQVQIPKWFVKLYGEDPDAYMAYQEHVQEERQAIRESLIAEERQRAEQYKAETNRWNEWAKKEMESVDAKFGANLSTDEDRRKDFLGFVLKYKPTDDAGNIDMVKGWELYQLKNVPDPAKSQARKAAADRVQSDTKPAEKPTKDYLTSADIRKMSWR